MPLIHIGKWEKQQHIYFPIGWKHKVEETSFGAVRWHVPAFGYTSCITLGSCLLKGARISSNTNVGFPSSPATPQALMLNHPVHIIIIALLLRIRNKKWPRGIKTCPICHETKAHGKSWSICEITWCTPKYIASNLVSIITFSACPKVGLPISPRCSIVWFMHLQGLEDTSWVTPMMQSMSRDSC